MDAHKVKELMGKLGIAEDQFRTLGLIPLVEVAWADGRVDFAERSAVMRFAKRKGWHSDGGDALVEGWLKKKPEASFFEQTRAALVALVKDRRGLGNAFPEDSLGSVLAACQEVAASSGGLFGLRNPIGPEEEKTLEAIAEGFGLGPWKEALQKIQSAPGTEAPGPAGHFLVGSMPEFGKDPIDFMTQVMREHGDVALVKLGPAETIFLSHPDAIKRVYMDNHRNYRLPPTMEDMKEFLGEGLLTTEGEHWRVHRRMIQPAFHMSQLTAMANTMTQITEDDLKDWHDPKRADEPINLMDKLMQLTLRVAGVCMFGMDLSADVTTVLDAAAICIEHMTQRSRQLFKLPIAVPTEANRKFVQARSTLDQIVLGLAKARREGTSEQRADVLQLLLDARDEETGRGLDEKELRDELLTMMGAGTETTALAMMWTLYFLSKYPVTRRAVQEEVQRVLGDRVPTLADIKNMPLVKQVIDESMRLRPPFYGSARTAVGEDTISGIKIKPGTLLFAAVYAMHRNPAVWPNPEGFDPERFTAEASKDRNPLAFLPFGLGPKKCIGMNFANMEMQLVMPMLVQRFEFDLLPGVEPEPIASLTLRSRNGCWVSVKARGASASGS